MRLISRVVNRHPSDDILEAHVMRTLPDTKMQAVEAHLHTCQSCRERFDETAEFVAAFRQALKYP